MQLLALPGTCSAWVSACLYSSCRRKGGRDSICGTPRGRRILPSRLTTWRKFGIKRGSAVDWQQRPMCSLHQPHLATWNAGSTFHSMMRAPMSTHGLRALVVQFLASFSPDTRCLLIICPSCIRVDALSKHWFLLSFDSTPCQFQHLGTASHTLIWSCFVSALTRRKHS